MKNKIAKTNLLVLVLALTSLTAFADDWSSFSYVTTGLSVSFCRVTSDTYTWKFRNDYGGKITYMKFRYSYIDADTGRYTTDTDILPGTLRVGEVFGGWAAFTSNSRSAPTISVIEMKRE